MFKMSSSTYDFLKKAVMVWMPALITCFSVIATTLNNDIGTEIPISTIVTIATAVETCVGVILGISSSNYYKDEKHEQG